MQNGRDTYGAWWIVYVNSVLRLAIVTRFALTPISNYIINIEKN